MVGICVLYQQPSGYGCQRGRKGLALVGLNGVHTGQERGCCGWQGISVVLLLPPPGALRCQSLGDEKFKGAGEGPATWGGGGGGGGRAPCILRTEGGSRYVPLGSRLDPVRHGYRKLRTLCHPRDQLAQSHTHTHARVRPAAVVCHAEVLESVHNGHGRQDVVCFPSQQSTTQTERPRPLVIGLPLAIPGQARPFGQALTAGGQPSTAAG